MRTSIVLMGCSQPSRLAPERAPRIEKGSDVKIDHPVLSPAPLSADPHRLQSRSPRSIAVRVGVELRLHLRLQIQAYDRLSDSVRHSGHPEDSDLALPVLLRYFDCPHRRREVASR